jgi:integrase
MEFRMIARTRVTVLEYVEREYLAKHLNVGKDYAVQLKVLARHLDRWKARPFYIDELDRDAILAFLKWRKPSVSPGTLRSNRSGLVTLANDAKQNGFMFEEVGRIESIRQPKRNPKAWWAKDVESILKVCQGLKGRVGSIPASQWWIALVLVIYNTSCRLRAARELRWSDVHLDENWMLMDADTQKHYADQVKQLLPSTKAALLAIASPQRTLVFPYPWRSKRIWEDWRAIVAAAGLEVGPKSGFHRLRRTHATILADRIGIDAARESLGHSDVAMTMRYVDDSKLTNKARSVNSLPDLAVGYDPQLPLFD